MPKYLYVPFKKDGLPKDQQKLLKHWIALEKAQSNDVVICYQGERTLKGLPENATVSVLFLGIPGARPALAGSDDIDMKLLVTTKNMSGHLRLYQGSREQVCIPDVATQMIADGLLHKEHKSLNLNLFFFNAGAKARELAQSFLHMIKEDHTNQQSNIRVQYFNNDKRSLPLYENELFIKKVKTEKNKTKPEEARPATQAHAFLNEPAVHTPLYNKKECYPKLTLKQIYKVAVAYQDYKSARFYGLSGMFGLNGFFSSDASSATRTFLLNCKDEVQAYNRALKFVKTYPENQFAIFLKSAVEQSRRDNQTDWNKAEPAVQSAAEPKIK